MLVYRTNDETTILNTVTPRGPREALYFTQQHLNC